MKKILLLLTLTSLASCTLPGTSPQTPAPTVTSPTYPTTQTETPATRFCIAQGGTVSVEKSGSLEKAYCTTKDGKKIDAWQYMSDATIVTHSGMMMSGMDMSNMSGMSH